MSHRGVMCAEKVAAAGALASSVQQMSMDCVLVGKPPGEGEGER